MSELSTFELSIKNDGKNLLIVKKEGEKIVRTRSPKIVGTLNLNNIREKFKGIKYLVLRKVLIYKGLTSKLKFDLVPKVDENNIPINETNELVKRKEGGYYIINPDEVEEEPGASSQDIDEGSEGEAAGPGEQSNKFTISFSKLKRTIPQTDVNLVEKVDILGHLSMNRFIKLLMSEFKSIKPEGKLTRVGKVMNTLGQGRRPVGGGRTRRKSRKRRRKSRKRKKTLLKKKKSKRRKSRKLKKRRR